MNSGNKEAASYLDYYLDEATPAEFAVMLSAPWGAGKTHFIKSYLSRREAQVGKNQPSGYLYASLYGVTNTASINQQFINQIYPMLDKKISRVAGTLLGGFFDKAFGAKSSESLFQDIALKLEGKVLVIDDLERCSMKIGDALGFINTLVEHEDLKVIVLTSEVDIPNDQKAEYAKQKEKLIGKTIKVEADPEEVLSELSKRLRSAAARDTILREKTSLLATLSAKGSPNYRNLRAILSDYERLVEAVDDRLKSNNNAMRSLLLYMIAVGNEFRSGELSEAELRYLSAAPPSPLPGEKIDSKSKRQLLVEAYPEVEWVDPIISPAHIATIFTTGSLCVEKINDELSRHPDIVGRESLAPWRLLWEWIRLPRTIFLEATKDLLRQLENQEITHPGVILHIAGISLTFRAHGYHLLGNEVEPKIYIEQYVQRLLDAGRLESERSSFGFDGWGAYSHGFHSENTPEFRAIYDFVKQAVSGAERQEMELIAKNYLTHLKAGPGNYMTLYESDFSAGHYGHSPFLHHISAAEFCELLIQDSCCNDMLVASLDRRYAYEGRNAKLAEEYPWLASLRLELNKIIKKELPPFQAALKTKFDFFFGKLSTSTGIEFSDE